MSQRGEELHSRRVAIDAARKRSSDAVGAARRSQGVLSGDERKQLERTGIGTKSQQALQLQLEQNKQERKIKSREQKQAEAERQFALRQQKKKEKHKGR